MRHLAQGHQVQAALVLVSFVMEAERPGQQVDASLACLSDETLSWAEPKLFAADNHELVRLFRRSNPHGVLADRADPQERGAEPSTGAMP
ncbi:MAG: hypothetical protein ABI389_15150 [Rhodanobacter sp.]